MCIFTSVTGLENILDSHCLYLLYIEFLTVCIISNFAGSLLYRRQKKQGPRHPKILGHL